MSIPCAPRTTPWRRNGGGCDARLLLTDGALRVGALPGVVSPNQNRRSSQPLLQQSLFPGGRVSPSRRPDTRWLPVSPRVQYLPVSGLRARKTERPPGQKIGAYVRRHRVRELVEGGAGVADVQRTLGVSVRTAYRLMATVREAGSPPGEHGTYGVPAGRGMR